MYTYIYIYIYIYTHIHTYIRTCLALKAASLDPQNQPGQHVPPGLPTLGAPKRGVSKPTVCHFPRSPLD